MVRLPKVAINTDISDGLCFGCGRNNPLGLKLHFEWDGETARGEFTPDKHHQGWKEIVHGGIITCALDEAMTYAARFHGLNCLTARMHVTFKRPAAINEILVLTSTIIRNARRLIETKASLFSQDGSLVAEATAVQFVIETSTASASSNERPRSHARK